MSRSNRETRGCLEIFARLSEYLDDELDEQPCARIEGHMEDCPPCQAFLESLRRTVEWIEAQERPPLPEEVRRRVQAASRELEPPDSKDD